MKKKAQKTIRVRIAPSPTGYLHIGTARTALFNYLFAKRNEGKFVLRIEDTDLERSKKEYEENIIENLKWLGIDWDEGPDVGGKYEPYRQTERLDIYEKYIKKLLANGSAYYCFCSKEELEEKRKMMMAQGLPPKYDRKCAVINLAEAGKRVGAGEPGVIRLRIPETTISFEDQIRGKITFDGTLIGDITIAKDARTPLYNFAVVVDDEEMEISHVIRGEDHIANTPKQIFIQKALGFKQPVYAHLPLILNPDRSKMSKRYLDTSIQDYRVQGYLPEALVNFIALLGWHPQDDREIFDSLDELAKEFDIERVQKAGAAFNIEKLDWLNAQYIKKLNDKELADRLDVKPTKQNLKIIALSRERIKKLSDFKALSWFFYELPDYEAKLLIWKNAPDSQILENLKMAEGALAGVKDKDFTKEKLEKILMLLAEKSGRGETLWPLRAALSGQETSPGPFEILDVLGKEESLRRIKIAIEKLQ